MTTETFGQRLRRLRLAAGYSTQLEFAQRVCVTNAAVCYWEADRKLPRQYLLTRLARVLKTPEPYLRYGVPAQ